MYSSNQVLEISGDLECKGDFEEALEYCIKKSDWYDAFTRTEDPLKPAYQVLENGAYCIGILPEKGYNREGGWKEFGFNWDAGIVAAIIKQHLMSRRFSSEIYWAGDGTTVKGYKIKVMNNEPEYTSGIKDGDYGILMVEAFSCYYAK